MQKSTLPGKNPLIAIALLATFSSCHKSGQLEATPASDNIASLQQAIAKSTGSSPARVVYLKDEKQFVVEDDGYITLEDAQRRFGKSTTGTPGQSNAASQRLSYYTVSPSRVNALKIYADYSVPEAWVNALDAAIDNWNKTGSNVHMERTNNYYAADTKVSATYNPLSLTVATSYYPDYYGFAGRKININTSYNSMWVTKKIFVMTHELGHTLGLGHTNGTSGALVEGTPFLDAYSVMNSVCIGWVGFSEYDLVAIKQIYPAPIPEEPVTPEEPVNTGEPTP